jgi:molecular chaperone HscB
MNYFEFYNLPESFFPDENAIKSKYRSLSREYHPDYFAGESDEKQREILELSTLNTNAYRTLSNFDRRLQYILDTHGLLDETKKNQLPNDFLMEMMDINEQIMELEIEPDAAGVTKIRLDSDLILTNLEKEAEPLMLAYPTMAEAEKQKALETIKIYYLKKKYLLRIQESLDKFAAR